MGTEQEPAREEHWADRVAGLILASGRPPVISTGISPSGEIHIGNMREVLTADAAYRALKERGAQVGFNYVADNFDPLRKVYPFLDPEEYEPLVGRPLSEIPCPCGEHASYAEHFLQPFLTALERLAVRVDVERADQMYKSGRMRPYIVQALEQRDRIAAIMNELTGKQVEDDWSPFNPLCAECGRINRARVTGFHAGRGTVSYACSCGSRGDVSMDGGGKLIWRIDWPARWMALGVTVEPFGKDHATRGGSYDTGARIVREVFGGEPPFPIPYEWIRLRGQGDMSSSKGNVLAIQRILEVAPPEALRFLIIRERPERTISFDPGLPLLQLVEQMDQAAREDPEARAIELSRAGAFAPLGVPYKHLVVVGQAAGFDTRRMIEILRRTGYGEVGRAALEERTGYARRWLERFAPEEVRFEVQQSLPAEAASLGREQRVFLGRLAAGLRNDMDGEAVHRLIYELAGELEPVRPAQLFQAIYLSLLGKPRGPRAGWFVALLGPAFCAARFREASGGME